MVALLVAIVVAGVGAQAPPVGWTARPAPAAVVVAEATATPNAIDERAIASLAVTLVAQAQRDAPDRKLLDPSVDATPPVATPSVSAAPTR